MNKNIEIWKNIPNYEGIYQASNLGRIKRLNNNKLLTQWIVRGYFAVKLSKNGKAKTFYVHKLVLTSFTKINNKEIVNHKDGNKLNNHIDNLEWCSQSENVLHAYRNRLNPGKKRKVIQYDLNGNFIKIWESQTDASKNTGISRAAISYCCNKKRKNAGGYIWKNI